MVTASAPISPDVLTALRISFCAPILEAYGQTEGTGGEFCTDMDDGSMGHVGGPTCCNEFKLIDVPEMKYTSKDLDEDGNLAPRGEICVRGNNVIPGYYKNEEKTKESIDEDGWLHSGDIGVIIPPRNCLRIVDRRKNIFKLSQGEYIAPDKLEQAFKLARTVADIFVYGDSLKSCLVAIVQGDKKEFMQIAAEKGLTGEYEDLITTSEGKKVFLDDLNLAATNGKLKGFERIKDVYVELETFESLSLLTTTSKVKRVEAKEHFMGKIDEMYAKFN